MLSLSEKLLINPLSAKFIKWSNTLKQFVGKLPTNCLSVFDHFLGLALKGLRKAFSSLDVNDQFPVFIQTLLNIIQNFIILVKQGISVIRNSRF